MPRGSRGKQTNVHQAGRIFTYTPNDEIKLAGSLHKKLVRAVEDAYSEGQMSDEDEMDVSAARAKVKYVAVYCMASMMPPFNFLNSQRNMAIVAIQDGLREQNPKKFTDKNDVPDSRAQAIFDKIELSVRQAVLSTMSSGL